MSQTVPASFAAMNTVASKSLDFALVIAGWPTIYTVVKDNYTLSGTPFADFSALRAWADLPVAVGSSAKGRPEEGGMTLAEMEVSVLDRVTSGARELTVLASREADLRGPAGSSGTAHTLAGNIASSNTTIPVSLVGTLPAAPNVVYIGLECIRYGGVDTVAGTLTDCTRGYLMTSPTRHKTGTYVYTFMPSVYRRKAILYKGYQNLGLENWAPAFGGAIAGIEKRGSGVTFRVMSTTWHTYNDSRRVMFFPGRGNWNGLGVATMQTHMLQHDHDGVSFDLSGVTASPDDLEPDEYSTYLVGIHGHWAGIKAVTP